MQAPLRVFLFSLFILVLFAAGYVDTIDADPSIQTALSLWNHHRLGSEFQKVDQSFYFWAQNGLAYSKMGLLQPILYLVPLALATGVAHFGFSELRFFHFFVSLVNPFLTALMATVFFLIFRLKRSERASILLTVLVIAGSLLLPYSKTCHREPLQALLLLIAFYFIESAPEEKNYMWAGCAIGLGVLTKLAFAVPAFPLLLLGIFRARRLKVSFAFLTPLVFFGLIYLIYSYSFSGGPFNGYGEYVTTINGKAWKTDFGTGFWSQWIWSYRGLLFYSPLLMGLLFVSRRTWRVESLLAILAAVLLQSFLYAKWGSPWGGEALGPRYLVVILPLLLVLFRDLEWKRELSTVVVLLFAIISIGIQIPLTAVKLQQYYTMESRSPKSFKAPAWQVTPKLFLSKLAGREEVYPLSLFNIKKEGSIDVRDVPSLQGLNFWWWHLWKNRASLSSTVKDLTAK